jgi:anthranilate/para-aminobenzoate synthase component I
MFLFEFGEKSIVGASPEMLVAVVINVSNIVRLPEQDGGRDEKEDPNLAKK